MKRIISIIMAIILMTFPSFPVYATEAEHTPKSDIGKKIDDYIKSDDDELLVLRHNYAYMKFVDDFKSDALSVYLLEMTDRLIKTGSAPDKDKYMKTLINIIATYDQDCADDIAKQKTMDNLKSIKDYALDVEEMGINAVSVMVGANPEASALQEELLTAIDGLSVLQDSIVNWIDALSKLETIMQDYSRHDALLKLIEDKSDGELKEAAKTLRKSMESALEIKLDTYADVNNENFMEYGEFFFSDVFIDAAKHTTEYKEDGDFRFLVDESDKAINAFFTLKSAWDLGTAIGTMVGDVVVGGENIINRILEMMALYDISLILQSEIPHKSIEFSAELGGDREISLAEEYIALSNYLIGCRIRGEYIQYSIVAKDAGLLSWFNRKSAEEALEWYESKSDKIIALQNDMLYGKGIVHISGTVVDKNNRPASGLYVKLFDASNGAVIFNGETNESGFFEGTAKEGDATIEIGVNDEMKLGSTLERPIVKGGNDLGVFKLNSYEGVMVIGIDGSGDKDIVDETELSNTDDSLDVIIEKYKLFIQAQTNAVGYLIYDIDKDGYPEVFINEIHSEERESYCDIYFYSDDGFKLLDRTHGPGFWHVLPTYASYPDGSGLVEHGAVKGKEYVSIETWNEGENYSETVYQGDYYSIDDIKYYKNSLDLPQHECFNHQYYQNETSSPYFEGSYLLAQSATNDFTALYEAFDVSGEQQGSNDSDEEEKWMLIKTVLEGVDGNKVGISQSREITTEYIYDDNYNCIEEKESFDGGTPRTTNTYGYDEEGRMISMETPTGGPYYYTYNESGQEIQRDDGADSYITSYDDHGNISRYEHYSGGEMLNFMSYSYEYDDEGNAVVKKCFDKDGIVWIQNCKYDDNNNLTMEEHFAGGDQYSWMRAYVYDESSHKTVETEYSSDNIMVRQLTFEYDQNGNLIKENDIRDDKIYSVKTYYYEKY